MVAGDPMSEIAYDIIMESLGSLTEDEALDIFHKMRTTFGWSGTFFTRADAELEWRAQTTLTYELDGEPLPDEMWETIATTWAWRKGLIDVLTDRGWDLVYDAVHDAIGDT